MSVRRGKRRDPKTGVEREFLIVDVDYEHPDGTRQRVRKVPPVQTRRGAEQYERDLRQALADGSYRREEEPADSQPPPVPVVTEFWKEFVSTYVEVNNKPSEIAQKKLIFKYHIDPVLGAIPLDEIVTRIEPFKSVLRAKGLKAKTVNNILTVVSKMLRYAEERRVIPEAPRIRLLKIPPCEFDFLTFEEFETLLEGACEEPDWYAAILVAGEAGLRRGEVIGLERRDIDFDAGNIKVMRSIWRGHVVAPKSGRSRIVPMTDRVAAALKAVRHLRGPRVFCQMDGKPMTQGLTHWPLRRACKRAGLRMISWHVLRHTFCSHLAMRGAAPTAIQELAGHESFETTKRYLHLAPVMLRETVRLLEGRGGTKRTATDEDHGTAT